MVNVVVLEPWFGGSHRSWAEGFRKHSTHDVQLIHLPAHAWRWRLRAAAAWFAEQLRKPAAAPDLIIASGLLDVASLRGLLRGASRSAPLVLYLHESQGGYPGRWDTEAVSRNWLSMLAADQVWFNSHFHRKVAAESVDRLLTEMPADQRVRADLSVSSHVVHPGVDLAWTSRITQRPHGTPPRLVWPHRWDHDKNPDVFGRALDRLEAPFELVLAGEDATPPSPVRRRILDRFGSQVVATGPFAPDDYRRWLQSSDIVASCTAHEFFGIAVVEALAAGCHPVLPRDFSYPELVGPENDHLLYEPGSFGSALESAVEGAGFSRVDVSRFDWRNRILDYDARIADLVG